MLLFIFNLGHWLQRAHPSTAIELHNLAQHGYTSKMMSEFVQDYLQKAQIIEPLTSNDIVFIDHSVNDDSKVDTQQGLESLIRTFLTLSKVNSPVNIVILAAYPELFKRRDWMEMYSAITNHYKLPLWSFNDVANSPVTINTQNSIYQYMLWHTNHPSWHIHLFLADLYAQIMTNQFNECKALWTADMYNDHSQHTSKMQYRIPAPLYLSKNAPVTTCKASKFVPFLHVSYDNIKNNGVNNGSFYSTPSDSWQVNMNIQLCCNITVHFIVLIILNLAVCCHVSIH